VVVTYPSIGLEDLRKNIESLRQYMYSRFPGRDSNPGPPEHEGILTTTPRVTAAATLGTGTPRAHLCDVWHTNESNLFSCNDANIKRKSIHFFSVSVPPPPHFPSVSSWRTVKLGEPNGAGRPGTGFNQYIPSLQGHKESHLLQSLFPKQTNRERGVRAGSS
jgi:hypothetical protein